MTDPFAAKRIALSIALLTTFSTGILTAAGIQIIQMRMDLNEDLERIAVAVERIADAQEKICSPDALPEWSRKHEEDP